MKVRWGHVWCVALGAVGSLLISMPVSAQPEVPPTISKKFGVAQIPLGGTTTLTFTIANPNPAIVNSSLGTTSFTDTLPAGLVVASPNGLTVNGLCGDGNEVITAVAGSSMISFTIPDICAPDCDTSCVGVPCSSSCTFSVNVTGITTGTKINTTSTLTSDEAPDGGPASDTLAVVVLPAAPVVSQWGLAGLVLLLGAVGWLALGRWKRRV